MAQRMAFFAYGAAAYVFFLGTFLYAIGFIMKLVVPKNVDDGLVGPVGIAIAVNVGLLSIFAIQHTIMARPVFKRWWTTIIPAPLERSTFVLVTCAILSLIFWQWRPLTNSVWHIETPALRGIVLGVGCLGWLLVLYSTFLIDHFDLFGLRQVYLQLRDRPYTHRPFAERAAYRFVRHPLMLGFLVAFWAAPDMSGSRLLFCIVTTSYVLCALHIEEHDLVGHLGDAYRNYRRRTPMLIPFTKFSRPPAPVAAPADPVHTS